MLKYMLIVWLGIYNKSKNIDNFKLIFITTSKLIQFIICLSKQNIMSNQNLIVFDQNGFTP